jgi:predicted ATP-dependent serine protease
MSGKLGELFVCKECGVVQIRTLINQTRCEDCRGTDREKERREKKKEYHRENFGKIPEAPAMPKPEFALSEVNAAAKKHGMSYGRYVAAWKYGNAEPPVKAQKTPKKKKGA